MIQDELLSVRDIAKRYGVSEDLVRHHWSYRPEWPVVAEHATTRGNPRHYRADQVDQAVRKIRHADVEGWSLDDIAAHYGVSRATAKSWRSHAGWEPIGKRGRVRTYAPADVEAHYRTVVRLPKPEGSPADLLTWAELCEYLGKGGVARKTMEYRRWAGEWPEGEIGADGVERWLRSVVEQTQRELARGGKPK